MVGKSYVAILEKNNLECKRSISGLDRLVLQVDILPLHDELLAIVQVPDLGVVGGAGIEVSHERGDVLSGGQPGVNVVARVEEAPGGDGDVLHRVTVEWELEAEVDGGCSPVAGGEHVVLLHLAPVWSGGVVVVKINKIVLLLLNAV